jgi:hypothetical protein
VRLGKRKSKRGGMSCRRLRPRRGSATGRKRLVVAERGEEDGGRVRSSLMASPSTSTPSSSTTTKPPIWQKMLQPFNEDDGEVEGSVGRERRRRKRKKEEEK